MSNIVKENIRVIAFDADDTLWDNQSLYDEAEKNYGQLLAPYTFGQDISSTLFKVESSNMPLMGYGTKAFSLSMIETALRVSRHQIDARQLAWLQDECYSLLNLPATPLDEVEFTLKTLQLQGWPMAVFTKGELLDQEHKLQRSGLADYFEHVEITSDKTEHEFRELCRHLDIEPEELLMVGNSLKSDITPALAIGAAAVHIPFHVTWELEHSEHFEHPRLRHINHFSELLDNEWLRR